MDAAFAHEAAEKVANGTMTPFELYLYGRATKAEAENEKLWLELEKFLVVGAPQQPDAPQEPPESPAPSPEAATPPPTPSREDEEFLAQERKAAEEKRARMNLERQLAEQEALLSRQEEQDMYAYLKSTPTQPNVKHNFALPGANRETRPDPVRPNRSFRRSGPDGPARRSCRRAERRRARTPRAPPGPPSRRTLGPRRHHLAAAGRRGRGTRASSRGGGPLAFDLALAIHVPRVHADAPDAEDEEGELPLHERQLLRD